MKQRIAFALILIVFAMSGVLHYREYRKSQEISDILRIQAEIEFKRTSLMVYKGRKGLLRATEVDLTQSGLMRSLRKSAENQCAKAGNRQEFALCETIVRGKETAGVSTSGRCVQRCTRRRRVSGLRHKTSRRRCLARTEPAPCKPDARVRPAAEQTTSTSTRSQPAASRGA